ncbi:Hypothetical protein, putative [Bodo saltans]|uniref:Uncharacterized protein n=1 Tax=Bodo saltans TaxID=75058 RepID=A0A0S4JFS9_BODSA|nr:Hypothetical protein, putative [Bodo saltans]|eukprot:CUG87287.1 Hypothetical protein, putative [Bodo saltans]
MCNRAPSVSRTERVTQHAPSVSHNMCGACHAPCAERVTHRVPGMARVTRRVVSVSRTERVTFFFLPSSRRMITMSCLIG